MPLSDAMVLNDDVAIVDSRMNDVLAHCAEAVNRRRLRVVLVSVPDDDLAVEGLLTGVRGIVYQSAPPEQIIQAVNLVRAGGVWAPRHVLFTALSHAMSKASGGGRVDSRLSEKLSRRERDVFRLAAAGAGNKQIADRLSISEATVKVHLTHIFKKLGLQSRGQLAAAYHGILQSS